VIAAISIELVIDVYLGADHQEQLAFLWDHPLPVVGDYLSIAGKNLGEVVSRGFVLADGMSERHKTLKKVYVETMLR
jgi:hypothetical protein